MNLRVLSAAPMGALLLALALANSLSAACTGGVSLTGAYTQNFNTLPTTGTGTTNTFALAGWLANRVNINAGTGSSNTGALYSFGTDADRALGSVGSNGTGTITWGVCLQNNGTSAITNLSVSFNGEQWRDGGNATPAAQSITVDYSADATDLSNGTYTAVAGLTYTSTNNTTTPGALNPPATSPLAADITVNIPVGGSILLRWTDVNHAGNDHGLAIDDFAVLPSFASSGPTLTISDASIAEGNSGQTDLIFRVTLAGTATGPVTFSYATSSAGATATAGSDYTAVSGTGSFAPETTVFEIRVPILGDTTFEPDENFFVNLSNATNATVADNQGEGRILNDDAEPLVCTPTSTISSVQGSGLTSPVVGTTQTIRGIVTGRRTNGFFLQGTGADIDADANTSDGIFVFTSSTPTALAAIGAQVCATGTVTEFGTNPTSTTQLSVANQSTGVRQISTSNPLPAAVALGASLPSPTGDLRQLERLEGMRASLASGFVTVGNTESAAGLFYVVASNTFPMREPGIEAPRLVPVGSSKTIPPIPRYDANPEIIVVNSNALGQPSATVTTPGQTVSNLIGVVDQSATGYRLLQELATPITLGPPTSATPIPDATANQITVGSFNLENYTGTATQQAKAILAIRDVLKTPDVLGLVEINSSTALVNLTAALNSTISPSPNYVSFLGSGTGTQNVGFLVKSSRINVVSHGQVLATETFLDPTSGATALVHDRPPYVVQATARAAGGPEFPFTAIVVHNRSLIDVDNDTAVGSATEGARVRRKRQAQAESIAAFVQSRQLANPAERIAMLGDYNAFEFNDGYVDVLGTLTGEVTPDPEVVLSSADVLNPNLVNLVKNLPTSERYSFTFNGVRQTLDHALVTQNFVPSIARFTFGRVNAGFPEQFGSDTTRPERVSDHDAPVMFVNLPNNPPVAGFQLQVVPYNVASTFLLNANDPDGSTVTLALQGQPNKGTVSLNSAARQATYTPNAASSGVDEFRYQITDAGNLSASGRVQLARDFTGGITSTITAVRADTANNRFLAIVRLVNNSGFAVRGPIHLHFANQPSDIALQGMTGVFQGAPYFTLPNYNDFTTLAPGAAVTVNVFFTKPATSASRPAVSKVISGYLVPVA